jgi:hypothetical protein
VPDAVVPANVDAATDVENGGSGMPTVVTPEVEDPAVRVEEAVPAVDVFVGDPFALAPSDDPQSNV